MRSPHLAAITPLPLSCRMEMRCSQCQSKVGAVPFGSVLCYHQLEWDKVDVPPARKRPFVAIADQPQLAASSSQTASDDRNATSESPASQQPAGAECSTSQHFCDLPLPKSAREGDEFARPLLHRKIIAIERLTRSQGSSELWKKLRRITLTCSRLYLVTHRKEVTE